MKQISKLFLVLTTASVLCSTSALALSSAGGIDSYTVLCLHGDGTAASTSFPDASSSAHTMTANGAAQVSTTSPKFGTGSYVGDGNTGTNLTTPSSSDFSFGTAAFTIDLQFKWEGANQNNQGFIQVSDSTWSFRLNGAGNTVFGQGGVFRINYANTYTKSTWYHVEIDREGTGANQTHLYINGTKVADGTVANTITDSTSLYVGSEEDNTHAINGNLDEIRVSKGIARHTANFTAPTVAYSVPSHVKTINGLALANVKKINGLAIANVKTWNGLS